jgi:diguanylate cyclase (GGDEF)-like protein
VVTKQALQSATVPAGLENWVAHRLVSAHQRIILILTAGHLLNMAAIVAVFAKRGNFFSLAIISAILTAACGHRLWIGKHIREERAQGNAQATIRKLEQNTIVLAMTFSGTVAWLMPMASAQRQLLLATAAATLIAAAGYTMRTLPRAALAYIAILSIGVMSGLIRAGGVEAIATCVLLMASAILLGRMAIMAHRLFVVRILRERDAANAAETVRLLLNDYEDHGSDWLFELSGDGKLYNVTSRFAQAAGRPIDQLEGTDFAGLFVAAPETDQLRGHVDARRAFRGLALRLTDGDDAEPKWWSVSGRPTSGGATSIACYRGVICDITVEKQAEARVRHLAHFDSLTELPNRLRFTSMLNRAFSQRDELALRIATIYIDVDNFKSINDMFGHPVGDTFLRQVADRLQANVEGRNLGSEMQLVARLGGDEFAIMLIGEDVAEQTPRLAAQLVEDLAKPYLVADHEINSSISVGFALAPEHATSAPALLSNADIALYAAKARGRNQWLKFEPGMDLAVQQRHALERDLRSALANDEMRLFLQPLVDVESGQQTGFEALIRWDHPIRGLVAPLDFIPVAEESGLIVPIGEWVLRNAIAEAATWHVPMSIAVNLSPVQLRSANLLPTVVNALAHSGLDPARLELEITEGVLMHDSEANIAILNRLHALGVKIALDDFGTGYASLNYLLTFPFDKIKIDRSFITDLETREDCREIVGAVIGLANRLGMCTLAEGVEQEAQLVKLREQGCEMVQGWLFGKALPAEHYGSELRPGLVDNGQSIDGVQPPLRRTDAHRRAA